MDIIRIQRLTDSYSKPCEQCGNYGYAEGYRMFRNDKLIFELIPHANCCGSSLSYTTSDLISEILRHYGHEARVTLEIYGVPWELKPISNP